MKTKLMTLALLAASQMAYADSYDLATNRLTIPTITLPNGAIYNNVVVTIGQVLSVNTGIPAAADSYDPLANVLTIPGITVAGTPYVNAKVTIGNVLAATAGSPPAPTNYPAFAKAAVKNVLTAPSGGTVTYDNHGVIDGLYNCSLTNTGLNLVNGVAGNVPQFYLSVTGKSNGKAHVVIAQTLPDPAASPLFGSSEMLVSGNSITGYTNAGGAVSVNFAFAADPATGIDSISGTGTVVLNGKYTNTGKPYSNKANIACSSIRSL